VGIQILKKSLGKVGSGEGGKKGAGDPRSTSSGKKVMARHGMTVLREGFDGSPERWEVTKKAKLK